MFGANYFGQSYFAQGPAVSGISSLFPIGTLVNAVTRLIMGLRKSTRRA